VADIKSIIFYDDPDDRDNTLIETQDDLNGCADASVYGIQAIIYLSSVGNRIILYGADFYIIDQFGYWTGADLGGLADRDNESPDPTLSPAERTATYPFVEGKAKIPYSCKKEGRWIEAEQSERILHEALNYIAGETPWPVGEL